MHDLGGASGRWVTTTRPQLASTMLPGPPRSKQTTGRPSASASSTACLARVEARKQQVVRAIDLGDARMLDPGEPVDRIVDREALRLERATEPPQNPGRRRSAEPSARAAAIRPTPRDRCGCPSRRGSARRTAPQRPLASGRGALLGADRRQLDADLQGDPDLGLMARRDQAGGVAARDIDQSRRERLARQRIVSGEQVEPVAHQPSHQPRAPMPARSAKEPLAAADRPQHERHRQSSRKLGWRITQKVMW